MEICWGPRAMASVVVVGLVQAAPLAASSPSSSAAASKLGSVRKIVNLRLLLQPPSSKFVCLRDKSFEASAGVSAYSVTDDNPSFGKTHNVTSDELSIAGLGIDLRIVQALAKRGIINLFPIQRAVFQPALEGLDLIARAKTGTGKTLAFGIPILDNISREKAAMQYRPPGTPRTIILAPTRELAKQVESELVQAAPHLSVVCVYGGVSIEGQRRQLSAPVDVVVGTPGRIIDMLERGALRLNEIKFAILDEADQMLAVGFAEEVERIMQKLPSQRQTMLFSATMPTWIRKLTSRYLKTPTMIDLVGENEDKIAEGIKLYAVSTSQPAKNRVLGDLITVYAKGGKAIVFTKTKRDTDEVAAIMSRSIGCEALHGDISQYQREKTLSGFRDGRFSVLIATDVAARGLDVPNVDLIVHYEVPNDSETFVHRSGRTGRAGKSGTCILMYTLPQRRILRSIEVEVGCKFESIGPPAAEDVLASSSEHAAESIKSVHPDLAKLFLPAAEKLLQERGVQALAAAMAQVSGVNKMPPKRSLLTHEEGYMTLQLTGDHLIDSSAISSAVMRLSPRAGSSMGRVSIISSSMVKGGVFDLPEATAKELLSLQDSGNCSLTALKVLPELRQDYFQSYDRFGGGRTSNGGFRSGGSSYGGSSGYGSNRSYAGSSFGGGGTSYNRSFAGGNGGSGYGGSSYARNTGFNSSSGNSSYNNGGFSYNKNADQNGGFSYSKNADQNGGFSYNKNADQSSYDRLSSSYGNQGYGSSSGAIPRSSSSAFGGNYPPSGFNSSGFGEFGGNSSTRSSSTGTGFARSLSNGFSANSYDAPSFKSSSSTDFGGNPTTANASTDFGWKKGNNNNGSSSARED